jgi:hypothetical protein
MKSRKRIRIHAVLALVALAMPIAAQEVAPTNINPVPLINQPLVPDAVAPGGKAFTLTVNGAGFASTATVNWNGSPLTTKFVGASQLTARVPASDIGQPITAAVTVTNPGPGGGTSNVAFFQVADAVSFSLSAATPLTVGTNPVVDVARDFNGDGKLDLAVANYSSNTVSVLLGNGDGTFQHHVDYATGTQPVGVAVGDFNHDGNLDLAVTNTGDNTVSILLGNGDGTFEKHNDYATGVGPGLVAVGDFNGDGNLDLAVLCNDDTSVYVVSVLLGDGQGGFRPHKDYTTGSWPSGIAVGDFNRDGILDLAISNAHSDTVSVLLGNGDGTFQANVDYPTAYNPRAMVTGDFNGDGYLDLAVACQFINAVCIMLGNGDGTFQPHVDYGTGDNPVFVELGDFNGDGSLDLALTNFNDSTMSILLGNGDGTFQPQKSFQPGTNPNALATGDFNGDGWLDLAVSNNTDGTVSIMLQNGILSWFPSNVDFGVQALGAKRTARKIELTNTGNRTVKIRSIHVVGADSQDFDERNDCGYGIPPMGHCKISVTFKPIKLGPRTVKVKISDDAPGSPQSVPLSGIGATQGPNATLSRKKLSFPLQLVGTTSPAQPVTLSNYGTQTLDISGITASVNFSEKDDCGSSLPGGEHCTISVSFMPTQRGDRTGTLTITDNAPDSPQKVNLTGTGTVVEINPTSLEFGVVNIGQQSAPQETTVTNVGKAKLHITNIGIAGTDSGDFFIPQDTCPNPGYLGAGKSCTITVVFKPTQVGSRSADVSITDDGGASPQQVSLSGTGETLCSGPCSIICRIHHCACRANTCVPASGTEVKEIASRQTCGQTNPFTELR